MTESPEYSKRKPGRPPKYPWDLWLDGVDKLLIPHRFASQVVHPPVYLYPMPKSVGDRPTNPAAVLQAQVLGEAAKRQLMVTTERRPDGGLGIRFVGESRKPAAPREMTREETFDRMLNGESHEIPVKTMTYDEFVALVESEAEKRDVEVTCEPIEGGARVKAARRELEPVARGVIEPLSPEEDALWDDVPEAPFEIGKVGETRDPDFVIEDAPGVIRTIDRSKS